MGVPTKAVDDVNVTQYYYNDNDQLLQETTDGNSIWYDYDENGAVTFKDAEDEPNATYVYDLRGRLAQLQPEGQSAVDYLYNHAGIRVRASIGASDIDYIVDPHNPTGYAQVFKEINPITDTNTVYIYGHDAIAQAKGASDPNYLLYDGHGSTRQLSNNVGTIVANYSYDAYGSMLGGNPAQGSSPATNLLYAGEHFDTDMQQYYLRARWYNPANGRFNRMDPFSGSNQDPQSLHKYLYAHCNPINNVDPTGMFSITSLLHVLIVKAQTAYMRTQSAITTYKQYSLANKILTAVGVGYVISRGVLSYFKGGPAVISLAFSKCPIIRNYKKWPNIHITFDYRRNDGTIFGSLKSINISVSGGNSSEAFDGEGGASIGVNGSFNWDFEENKPDIQGGFAGSLETIWYEKGPIKLYTKFRGGAGAGTTTQDYVGCSFSLKIGLKLGLLKWLSLQTSWPFFDFDFGNKKAKLLGMEIE